MSTDSAPKCSVSYLAADVAETGQLAAALAAVLPPSAVIALNGTLGAGKTRFVQAIAAAVGVDPAGVLSPTFSLIHEYVGAKAGAAAAIYHFDVYRLRDDDEFLELGPDEYFARPGWSLVEWGERRARCLPAERLEIQIEIVGPTARRFTLTARGTTYRNVLLRLGESLGTRLMVSAEA